MNKKNNPLLCDIQTGACETSDNATLQDADVKQNSEKPIKVIYYTDPICSSCWGIEPQLRKLKLEYGDYIDVEYRMGGLLPDWSYNSGGISKPSDVASHWDEVSVYYDMPIDGDVWLDDPLESSYPPSIAVKAAQMQNESKAIAYMRELREMVFLHKKNIAKWENMAIAAEKVGLDVVKLKNDFENEAQQLFREDLKLGKELGVRGFPTMFFANKDGEKTKVYGSQSYNLYEQAVISLEKNVFKTKYNNSWQALFNVYPTMTAKEFSMLAQMDRLEAEAFLNQLTNTGELSKFETKNGAIWRMK